MATGRNLVTRVSSMATGRTPVGGHRRTVVTRDSIKNSRIEDTKFVSASYYLEPHIRTIRTKSPLTRLFYLYELMCSVCGALLAKVTARSKVGPYYPPEPLYTVSHTVRKASSSKSAVFLTLLKNHLTPPRFEHVCCKIFELL